MVRSPVTFSFVSEIFWIFVDLKVVDGNVSTSKKSAERGCSSRLAHFVSIVFTSMVASIFPFDGSASSSSTMPVTEPFTFETPKCLTEKPALAREVSISHGAARAEVARAAVRRRAERIMGVWAPVTGRSRREAHRW
jgi:hypothetical protein